MRSRAELLAAGPDLKLLFFWGHTPPRDGSVSASCFSQWFEAPFEVEGVPYPTAEHFMMAEKARLFGDAATREKILACRTPGEAKALGRQVAEFEEARWSQEAFAIVVRGNLAKFGQNPALREFLLASRGRVLVEASPQDRIWGIGLTRDDPRASDPARWEGENLLGFALMEVREKLA